MKNALTVDVEDRFRVPDRDALASRAEADDRPSPVVESTTRLLDLFAEHDVHATFFVLGRVAERFPGVVADIAARGHEVASHGHGHQRVYDLGPRRFGEDLDRSCAAIESACGVRPRGYRAPGFSIDRRSLWAFDVLAARGFAYDSSVVPVPHPRYGIPGFARTPRRVRTRAGAEVQEFPLTTLRLFGCNLAASGGGPERLLSRALVETAFRTLNADGEPAVLSVHPREMDGPWLPLPGRGKLPPSGSTDRSGHRLKRLLERFEFVTMSEALRDAPGMSAEPLEVAGWN